MTDNNPTATVIANLALIDSMDDLRTINDHLKDAFDRARREGVKQFSVGQVVTFPLKGGKVATGKVVKINRKTVGVDLTHVDGEERPYGGGYNVPPSLLTAV